MAWCAGKGATGFDWALVQAAGKGQIEAMAWCAGKGATDFDRAMAWAAGAGHIEAMAWCAGKGTIEFNWAMIEAAESGQIEAMAWCATEGRLTSGDRSFTRAIAEAVRSGEYEAAELALAWGGDINDALLDHCDDRWVAAVRAGEITVEPQDPLEAYQPLGPFKFYD